MSTFVLVHGAYHGAWCWFEVVPELESRGHTVLTFDLPGHGVDTTPISEVTFEDYVDRVIRAIDDQEGPVVLVGHSMSGMVISQVAERRPNDVETLVYLTAYIPSDGESMLDQRVAGSLIAEHFHVDEDRGVGAVDPSALETLFYEDCSPRHLALASALVRAEPIEPLSTPVSLSADRFEEVPRVFLVCENDRTITPDHQQRMIENRGCDAVIRLDSSHSPFLSMPGRTAEALESAVERV